MRGIDYRIRRWRASAYVALPVLFAALTAADAPTGGEPGVHAFVLSNIYLAQGGEKDSCPIVDIGDLDRFYAMLPPAEQAKYAGKEKRQALEKRMNEYFGFRRLYLHGDRASRAVFPPGFDPKAVPTQEQAAAIGALNNFPKGAGRLAFQKREVVYSACSHPYDFPMLGKAFRTYEGQVAAGINLDGKVGKKDFHGPDGTPGVDNRLWRAVGCISTFRENSKEELARKTMMSALAPTLIELRGVDNLHDDPDVRVTVLAGNEALSRDARGDPFARATFTASPDPKLQATTTGRISGGVLTTDPVDLTLNYKEQIIDAPRHIRGARLRATFGKDGSIQGGIYGYYTLDSYYDSIEQMTQNGANLSRLSCPGVRRALDRLADGYRDPRTGRYTAISSAMNFVGVRAFVAAPQQVARAEASQ